MTSREDVSNIASTLVPVSAILGKSRYVEEVNMQNQPPQYPQGYPPNPQNNPYAAWQTQAAFSKSFTTPAIICLLLYIFLWVPGLIANIIYLNEAHKVATLTGTKPEGQGCLVAMLITFVCIPLGIGLLVAIGFIVAGIASVH